MEKKREIKNPRAVDSFESALSRRRSPLMTVLACNLYEKRRSPMVEKETVFSIQMPLHVEKRGARAVDCRVLSLCRACL